MSKEVKPDFPTPTFVPELPNGTFTIKSPKGGHRTLRITTQQSDKTHKPCNRCQGLGYWQNPYRADDRRPCFGCSDKPKKTDKPAGSRTVELMNGPDNEQSFIEVAFLNGDGRHLTTRPGLEGGDAEKTAKMLVHLATGTPFGLQLRSAGYELLESRRCVCCNRKLTTPQSVKLGIGPVCAEGGYGY